MKTNIKGTPLAVAVMMVIVPLVGLGDVGAQTEPLDEVIDAISETVCPEIPGTTLPGGVGVECPHGALWVNHYNGPLGQSGQQAYDGAYDSLVSPDGEWVYAIGQSRSQPQGSYPVDDLVVLAYDPATGQMLWEARTDAQLRGNSGPPSSAISPDGSTVFVTVRSNAGTTASNEWWDYLTVAFEAETGDELWATFHDNGDLSRGDWDAPRGLAVSPDSAMVVVTGQSNQVSNRTEAGYESAWGTVAYDAETGDELWVTPHFGEEPGQSGGTRTAFSPDGDTVFVTGYNPGQEEPCCVGDMDYVTVAYDAATGDLLWETRSVLNEGDTDWPWQMAVPPSGETVFVTGNARGVAATVAYDAETGDELWVARSSTERYALTPAGLELSPDGAELFTVFMSRDPVTGIEEYTTAAHDAATGAELWVAHWRPPGAYPGGQERPQDMALSPDGGTVFVTGWARAQDGNRAIPVVAYDSATGNELWVSLYNREGNSDHSRAIAVDPGGERVYVTGSTSTTLQGSDITTLAYPIDGPLV